MKGPGLTDKEHENGPDRPTPTNPPHPPTHPGNYTTGNYPSTPARTFHFTFTTTNNTLVATSSTPAGPSLIWASGQVGTFCHIPIHDDTPPILAHRAARIYTVLGQLRLGALNPHFGFFDRDADAKCHAEWRDWPLRRSHTVPHTAPQLDCTCGFYAVPADIPINQTDCQVELLVELTGAVIEHEYGYRAEHQHILEMRLPDCIHCDQTASHLSVQRTHADLRTTRGWYCRDHRHIATEDIIGIDTLQHLLGIPITTHK